MTSTRLEYGALLRDVRERLFVPSAGGPPRIGCEVECIPVDRLTRRPRSLEGDERSVLGIVRAAGAGRGWRETVSAKAGVPEVSLPDGARITFEPGAQIEYSSPPCTSASALLASTRAVLRTLTDAADARGADLLFVGVDPITPVQSVAPQLQADRYRRMRHHFSSIGPSGARMMRQTASLQIAIDAGPDPFSTWRLLNAIAPYMVAIFANSPVYEGRATGHQSFRRYIWATLDPKRTGLHCLTGDPVDEYVRFALAAPAFLLGEEGAPARSFAEWMSDGESVGLGDWQAHLGTLFPEVRPRGYFELRSADAVAPEWHAAPIAFAAGLCYDEQARAEASDLLGVPEPELLARAGRDGLRDTALARNALALFEMAMAGCARLGAGFLAERDRDVAEEYCRRYTSRGRSPADEARDETGMPVTDRIAGSARPAKLSSGRLLSPLEETNGQ